MAKGLLESSDRYHRSEVPESNILIIGVPNVGKSSLINVLRNKNLHLRGKATAVGNMPGVTRSVLTRIRMSNDPLIYLIDTPGIMMPNISNMHAGLKLALCGTMRDDSVGFEYMADYLLYLLNRHQMFEYVNILGLDAPSDDIRVVLATYALSQGFVSVKTDLATGMRRRYPDMEMSARRIIAKFRDGDFGRLNLDAEKMDRAQKKRDNQGKQKVVDLFEVDNSLVK